MKISFEKKIAILFSVITIGLIVAGIMAYTNNQQVQHTDNQVQHTREVMFALELVFSTTQDIVIGSHGYVITGDSAFLQPFFKAHKHIYADISKLKKLVDDNPSQHQRTDSLQVLIEARIDHSFQNIKLRNQKGFAVAQQHVLDGKGKQFMDEIRKVNETIQQEENQQLEERQEANRQSIRKFHVSFYFLLGIMGLILHIMFFTIRRNMRVRQKAEEALFIQNEWYNQTLISLGDGVIATDANGVITLINRAACELTGWKQQEAIGQHIEWVFQITNENSGLTVVNPLMEALRQNKIMWLANHTILKRKDGSQLFIDDSGAPIHNQEKEVIGGVLIFRDVTEKKKAEEQLKQYQHFFNNSSDLCYIANREGFFETINPTLAKALGYSESEMTGKSFLDFVHREDVTATLHEFENQATEAATVTNFTCRLCKKDDSCIWVEWNSIPHPITGKIYGIGRDITLRKIAAEQLEEYKHFFNNNNDLCGIANSVGYFETINTNFLKVLGYTEKEFCATPFVTLIHPDDVAATLQVYDNLKAGALVINFVNRYRKKDGSYLCLDWNATPDAHNGKLYCVARDITERRKVQEQLQAANQELESFSYSVSHDLRAPLRAVHGYAQILKEDYSEQLDEEAKRLTSNVMLNAKKMGHLIDDLLAFSRLGRKELVKNEISMKEMVMTILGELNGEARSDNTMFHVNELLPAYADTVIIKQVWVNLISNALKYSAQKEKTSIEISSEENDSEIIYRVKDKGAGFDMRYADKLFGVFQRLHSEKEFEGTGVGLAIVQRIVTKHGGKVWAESTVGEGATFYFSLPKNITT